MSWILSMILIFLNHPLSLGLILLLQTILISLITGILNLNFWFSYILFLIMIGGMLILFIYMTSIASNEKFKFSKNLMFMSNFMLISTLIFYWNKEFHINKMNISNSININTYNINLSMNKFFNYPNMMMIIMLMIYLLITLIAIVKITQSKMGTLRSKK
uniref:NADH-ubiquinone oxidoreductase chain 6 n=1 Tax=Liophloeus tessulatus TaxID=202024 RepID=J9PHN0_9CUCU|nr:NADH dehydrogenase subunit 6 [Liophloeus tessulatus]